MAIAKIFIVEDDAFLGNLIKKTLEKLDNTDVTHFITLIVHFSSIGKEVHKQVFIGLYVKDSRLVLGVDYYRDPLYSTPLAFDVVSEEELSQATQSVSDTIVDGTYCTYTNYKNAFFCPGFVCLFFSSLFLISLFFSIVLFIIFSCFFLIEYLI